MDFLRQAESGLVVRTLSRADCCGWLREGAVGELRDTTVA
jgi:hypothetical protein